MKDYDIRECSNEEADFVIDKLSTIISNGINKCLHDI